MFCSKCGKELRNEAAFCDGCGNPTGASESKMVEKVVERVYVTERRKSPSDGMTAEEKAKKLLAAAIFLIYAILAIGAVFSLLSENSELLSTILDGSYIREIEEILSEYSILLKIMVIVGVVTNAAAHYIIPYVKRDFDGAYKKALVSAISDAVMPLIPFAMVLTSDMAEYMTFTVNAYILYAVYAAIVIFRVICYKLAAGEERSAYYYSGSKNSLLSKIGSDNSDWKCRNCGSTNKATQDYCKDCGEYK